jgi:hypothetical protein
MRTRFSSGTTRPTASRGEKRSWAVIASRIWAPTLVTGFSDVIGSWKIMATSLPRKRRISSWSILVTSRSRNQMWPPTMRPGSGTRRRIDSAVMVLPQPDSPTTPSVSPSSTCRLTPSTARTVPREVANWVCRSSTRSSVVTGACAGRARRAARRR